MARLSEKRVRVKSELMWLADNLVHYLFENSVEQFQLAKEEFSRKHNISSWMCNGSNWAVKLMPGTRPAILTDAQNAEFLEYLAAYKTHMYNRNTVYSAFGVIIPKCSNEQQVWNVLPDCLHLAGVTRTKEIEEALPPRDGGFTNAHWLQACEIIETYYGLRILGL